MTQTISTLRAASLIRNSNGKIFSVSFIKRGDGSMRDMIARTGVSKGVSGNGRKFDAASHGLLTVAEFRAAGRNAKGHFEAQEFTAGSFRNIGIEGIRRLRLGGQEYTVVPE